MKGIAPYSGSNDDYRSCEVGGLPYEYVRSKFLEHGLEAHGTHGQDGRATKGFRIKCGMTGHGSKLGRPKEVIV
jgi:hypothetical protein